MKTVCVRNGDSAGKREVRRFSAPLQSAPHCKSDGVSPLKTCQDLDDVASRRRFVERDAKRMVVNGRKFIRCASAVFTISVARLSPRAMVMVSKNVCRHPAGRTDFEKWSSGKMPEARRNRVSPIRRPEPASACGRAEQSASNLPARDKRHTWTPCSPATPARCRCCWWPSRGGCVVRGFEARGAKRVCRANPWRRRQGVRASGV